jgi:LysM domain
MVAVSHPTAIRAPRRRSAPTAATYRRRRQVAAALALLIVVAVANLVLQLADNGPRTVGPQPVVERSVVVEPGDTVWSIAESLADGGDVRPVVDALVEANGGAALEVGDRLVLPLP